ncbi:GNAT family N-acetyltransferase [Ligilactobacillus acidipiscis]|nr:GNAT family N-acetyltransferase [Ligilactobacillus acidipiscis]GAW62999.1 GNAT family acetyltransferase [Ligilactobacillus acidipiscis]GEN20864.1 N-acetyltransferase [Ligilactobacillus acidipiscis]
MAEKKLQIRELTSGDDLAIKNIVQSVLREYHDDLPGTAYYDPELGALSKFYAARPHRKYWVVTVAGKVVGSYGLAEFDDSGTVEIQKLYLLPETRGVGAGKRLLGLCEEYGRKFGYSSLYIETLSNMKEALGLYEHLGFPRLASSKDKTLHNTCDVWLEKKL